MFGHRGLSGAEGTDKFTDAAVGHSQPVEDLPSGGLGQNREHIRGHPANILQQAYT